MKHCHQFGSFCIEISKARLSLLVIKTPNLLITQKISGFEKIPQEGGALIVYYHASIPIDYFGLVTRTYLEKGRLIRSVMDRNLIMMPGAEVLIRTFGAMPGGREDVIKLLKEGHLVGVAPGGGYEAQLAGKDYPVMWKLRRGFAVVAKEAGVPIIPMFTENVREAYVNMESGNGLRRSIKRTELI